MQVLRATTPAQLDDVNNIIHDYWFEVDQVTFDRNGRTLQIKFERPSTSRGKIRSRRTYSEWILEIGRVQSFVLNESEGIGRYDFNVLKYDEHNHTLVVLTGVPLTFDIKVDSVEILVREIEDI